MSKLSRPGATAILAVAIMAAPAWANEQQKSDAAQPVRTAAVATATMEMPHRNTQVADTAHRQSGESNGWGMLAAGLSVGLLIIARRRRG